MVDGYHCGAYRRCNDTTCHHAPGGVAVHRVCTPGGMVIVSLCPGQNEREESRKPGQGVSVVVETVHARGIGKNVVVVSLLSGQQLNCTPAVRAPRVSQDVIQQLYDQYDASPAKFRFYVPQLCNFLVHGRAERPLPYDVFILDKCEK